MSLSTSLMASGSAMLRKLDIARSWQAAREQLDQARAELAQVQHEQQRKLAALCQEMAELHDIVGAVVTTLRQSADNDVVRLRSELSRALLRLAPRDWKL